MRFPSRERFHQYCVTKRRTYLRQLVERRSPRAFYDLWRLQLELASSRFEVRGSSRDEVAGLAVGLRWLLLQDLHHLVRTVAPDFAPAPPSAIRALPGALHQVRVARSMLIAGEKGVGKEQLAILLHVLAGRPGALVRLSAAELGQAADTPTRQMMPERGTVYLRELEQIGERGQEELLAFLNGEARRRDLLIIVGTCREPRFLVSRHGVRRDVFVRVSQTEVRLPPLRPRSEDVGHYLGDVVFDLARVPPERLPELRKRAEELAALWSEKGLGEASELLGEALSYAMWGERKELALATLREPWCSRLARSAAREGSFAAICREVRKRRRGEPDAPGASEVAPRDRLGSAAAHGHPASAVPTHLNRDQLLREYYLALLREERGDLRRVAERAGRKLRVLHSELARLDVRLEAERRPTASHS